MGSDDVPFDLLDAEAPALIPQRAGTPFTLCLVDGSDVRPVMRLLDADAAPIDLINSLRDEVADDEAARGLRTAVSSAIELRSVTVNGGSARLDLEAAPELAGADRILAVAQIVCTLTHLPAVYQVAFAVQGEPLDVPVPDGTLVSDPVSLHDYRAIMTS